MGAGGSTGDDSGHRSVPDDRNPPVDPVDPIDPEVESPDDVEGSRRKRAGAPTYDYEARRVLWPWVARRTRTQVIALITISCLALGPLVALISILRSDSTPVHQLLDGAPSASDVTNVNATALGLFPATGELRVRVVVDPADDLSDDNGRLAQPIEVVINDVSGATTRTYQEGDTPAPFEVGLPLSEGSTTRYPFDRYRGSLFVVVNEISSSARERQLVSVQARSVIDDFVIRATLPDQSQDPSPITVVDWTGSRSPTTTIYAVWLMLLMWGLAVTGLLIVWAVVMWMVDIPFWLFGYFVGVLFALPPLRDSLPGRPPPGTIFDFGSFYWSITISGVNLIVLLGIWLRRTHAQERLRSLDPRKPN